MGRDEGLDGRPVVGNWTEMKCHVIPVVGMVVATLAATAVQAAEVNGGVQIGAVAVGREPRLSITPHLGIAVSPGASGFTAAFSEQLGLLPRRNGVDVVTTTNAGLGWSWERAQISGGFALTIYSLLACGRTLCGTVLGVAPGATLRGDFYLVGPLGVAASATVSWWGGDSFVLPGSVVATGMIGPVLRFGDRSF